MQTHELAQGIQLGFFLVSGCGWVITAMYISIYTLSCSCLNYYHSNLCEVSGSLGVLCYIFIYLYIQIWNFCLIFFVLHKSWKKMCAHCFTAQLASYAILHETRSSPCHWKRQMLPPAWLFCLFFFYRQHLTCYIAMTNIKLIVIMWSSVKIMAEVIPLLPILEMQRDRTCLQFIPVYSLPYWLFPCTYTELHNVTYHLHCVAAVFAHHCN